MYEERLLIDSRVTGSQRLHECGIYEIRYARLREKGVDVKMAVDMLVGAFKNEYDELIFVSSDSDFIPALDIIRKQFLKRVVYVGFLLTGISGREQVRPTKSLEYVSDRRIILSTEDVWRFVVVSLPK